MAKAKWEWTEEEVRDIVSEMPRVLDKPRGRDARFSAASGRIGVTMLNGVEVLIPVALIPDLARAEEYQLAQVKVTPLGDALEWPILDLFLDLEGLLLAVLGAKLGRTVAARKAGAATSDAKKVSSAQNGRKGGRPPKNPPPQAATAERAVVAKTVERKPTKADRR